MNTKAKSKQQRLTQEHLKECVEYDPATGLMVWRVRPEHHFPNHHIFKSWNSRFSGRVAGAKDVHGYRHVCIDNVFYKGHRLAWLYMTGVMPHEINHRDRQRDNNRWDNLEDVTRHQNAKNSSLRKDNVSGHVGVYYDARCSKWGASITVDGKEKFLGRFNDKDLAIAARVEEQAKHSFSSGHGKPRPQ